MKRKLTILNCLPILAAVLVLMGHTVAFGQYGEFRSKNQNSGKNNYPLVESFESMTFPPVGWATFSLEGDINWALGYYNHTPGGEFGAIHSYNSGNQDNWLVTPQISLPAEGNLLMSVWHYVLDIDWYGNNSIWVSTGSSDPAAGDYVQIWTPASVSSTWVQTVHNLAAYAGQNVYVAFRYQGDFAHAWVVDDVEIGTDINTDPVINVSPLSFNFSIPLDGSTTKTLKVKNLGFDPLEYEIELTINGSENGWISISPLSGVLEAGETLLHPVVFNMAGLELGEYTASLLITSNDTENPQVTIPVTVNTIEAGYVTVTNVIDMFTFPTGVSADGRFVSGAMFGGGDSYFWEKGQGLTNLQGEAYAISDNGIIGGTFKNEDYIFYGEGANCAGRWNKNTGEWEFLGINPLVPEVTSNEYNSGWGITADGTTVVGMQWLAGWQVAAFKWQEGIGYTMISGEYTMSNRPNGISANGQVIYGWAETMGAGRSAVIWYEDEMIFIDPDQWGEAAGASHDGSYVTGAVGAQGFIWSAATGEVELFDNTLNMGAMSPLMVLNDGTVFGYTAEGWPPFPDTRRAFVRFSTGEMVTFNDYAESRGMVDAQEWLFFTMSAITPDANIIVGAAMNPEGTIVSMLINFESDTPVIVVTPLTLSQILDSGLTAEQLMTIANEGTGMLDYSTMIQYVNEKAKQVVAVPEGKPVRHQNIQLRKAGTPANVIAPKSSKDGVVLNYDGENNDAIGLVAGGTFYGASRFPSEMVTPFAGYEIQSIDVFIGNAPDMIKLMIWGAGTTNTVGELILVQEFQPTEQSWNTIMLDEAVVIDGTDIWVGFEITHPQGTYILGVDGGPANPNGGFLSLDAILWEKLSDYGLNNNWNIRAMLVYPGVNWLSLNPATGSVAEGQSSGITATFNAAGMQGGVYNANIIFNSNDYQGTQVIVPVTLTVNAVYYTLNFVVNDGQGVSITDAVISVNGTTNQAGDYSFELEPGTYTYTVTKAGFFPVTEEVEMSNENQTVNVVIFGTSITEENPNQISIFPNPAKELTMVEAPFEMKEIRLFNMAGQLQRAIQVADFRQQINLSGLENGVYLLQIVTTQNVFNKQIQVIR